MTVLIQLNYEEAFSMMESAEEANGLLGRAEEVFALLARVIEDGDYVAHVGIPAMADLASRAIADFQEHKGETLVDLISRIRKSLPQVQPYTPGSLGEGNAK